MTRLEWGVIVSLIVSASSIIFTAGIVWQKVQANEVRIATLEATNSTNTDHKTNQDQNNIFEYQAERNDDHAQRGQGIKT